MTAEDRAFDNYIASQTEIISSKITSLENRLQTMILSYMHGNDASRTAYAKAVKVAQKLLSDMSFIMASNMDEMLSQSTKKFVDSVIARAQIQGAIADNLDDTAKIVASAGMKSLVKTLYTDAMADFKSAITVGQFNVERVLRATQQRLISESIVNATVAEGARIGDLQLSASALSGQFTERLTQMVNDKAFVQAGSKRFKPSYYAEMVARTKFHDAQSASAIAVANYYDTDLIKVSNHNTKTEICEQYEGKVFSISGKDGRFPPLTNRPPYHPNCLHYLYPVFESVLRGTGQLGNEMAKHAEAS